MPPPIVRPIHGPDLLEVGAFLNAHLDASRDAAQWAAIFRQSWCEGAGNHGFQLRDGDRLVGVMGAFYATRRVRDTAYTFCNISCWSVLPEYRRHSLRLAVALTSQPGHVFTDFTPTKVVAESLQFLKFRRLDTRQVEMPNLPSLRALLPGVRVVADPATMAAMLPAPAADAARDHAAFPWLGQAALADAQGVTHVVYKVLRGGGRSVAVVLGVSDRQTFTRLRAVFGHHLLLHQGVTLTRVDERYLTALPKVGWSRKAPPRKLCLAAALADHEVDDLYSELACIDLPEHFF